MVYFRILILTTATLFTKGIKAQKYEFGIGGYTTNYLGDLNPNNLLYYSNFGGSIFAKYNINNTWSIRLNYNYLAISASDRDFKNTNQQVRQLAFNNNLSEISILSEFNFFNFSINKRKNSYSPYVLAGLGMIKHNPFLIYGNEKFFLQELELERDRLNNPIKHSKLALVMPLGLGFKYNIKGSWNIAAELSYRIVFSDHIDNVTGYYPEKIANSTKLPNQQIRSENGIFRKFEEGDWYLLADPSKNYAKNIGTLRGDGKKWDGYMTAGITVSYTLLNTNCAW